MHKYIHSSISIISLAIFGYLIYTLWVGFEETLQAMLKLETKGLLIVLGLSLLNYFLRFLRWQWYLNAIRESMISVWKSLRYYLVGFAFTTTPGKAGEMVRSVFLKQHGISYPQSISMFFVERLSDLLATLILAAFILWHFKTYQMWIVLPVIFALMLITFVHHYSIFVHPIEDFLARRTKNSHFAHHFFEILYHCKILLHYRFLYGGLLLGIIAWGAEGIGFYYILHALEIKAGPMLAVGIYAMSLIIGALSFLPGGLGGTEAAMVMMLLTLGASSQEAFAATLICRLTTLWFAMFLGASAMLGLKLKEKMKYHDPNFSR